MTSIKKINIILHEPEIPQNTGNIARTCAATGASLHIIKPMGFTIDDKKLKRAGLDYWDKLGITYYENYGDFLDNHPEAIGNTYFFTTKEHGGEPTCVTVLIDKAGLSEIEDVPVESLIKVSRL